MVATNARMVSAWHDLGTAVVTTDSTASPVVGKLDTAIVSRDEVSAAFTTEIREDDTTMAKDKGRPAQKKRTRATVMGALRDAGLAVIFDKDTPLKTIQTLRPDAIVKGADYQEHEVVGCDFVKSDGGAVVQADLVSGHSTSVLVGKMRQSSVVGSVSVPRSAGGSVL